MMTDGSDVDAYISQSLKGFNDRLPTKSNGRKFLRDE